MLYDSNLLVSVSKFGIDTTKNRWCRIGIVSVRKSWYRPSLNGGDHNAILKMQRKCRGEPAFDWLFEIRAILIIQEAKYKLVYLTRLFPASLTFRLHGTEQCIHKHYTNCPIEKYIHRKITQCKLHAGMRPYVHNKYFNWPTPNMIQRFNARARVLKGTREVIL